MVSREERGARNSDALAKYKVCGGGIGTWGAWGRVRWKLNKSGET